MHVHAAHGSRGAASGASLADNYVQALEFIAFDRTLRHGWWRLYVGVLRLLCEIRQKHGTAETWSDQSTFLDADVSPASLGAMPCTLDSAVFEEHTPLPTGARLRAMRFVWLPRRVHLLRLVRGALTDGDEGSVQVRAAADELRACCEAEPVEADTEEWSPMLRLARCSAALAEASAATAEPGVAPDGAAVSAVALDAGAMLEELTAQCADGERLVRSDAGYPAHTLARLAHLTHLELPVLCIAGRRWAQQLPGGKRKKAKRGDDEQGEGAPVGEAAAPKADPRATVRDGLTALLAAIASLEGALRAETAQPEACVLLESEAAAWADFAGELPGDDDAEQLVKKMRHRMAASGKVWASELADELEQLVASVRHVSKLF